MTQIIIQKAAAQFGKGQPVIEDLGEGLIHRTHKVRYTDSPPVVLQCINQRTFPLPENIINNYLLVSDYLKRKQDGTRIPALLPTHHNKYFWVAEDELFWRACEYIPNSHSLKVVANAKDAFNAAKCFGGLTRSLVGLDPETLHIIIPDFHNLQFRYKQFEEAISKAGITRLLRATHVISELRQRKNLVDFYLQLGDTEKYPTRIMHHDCKIGNILFDENTGEVLCPVDLDTLMPGKFFSDLGDMIRTMVCPVDENSVMWEEITINGEYYNAIFTGYLEGTGNMLTGEENRNLHYAGLMMTYMQCLRFVTDFLQNDIYYKTTYPEQNLNRALNQLILLEQLEKYLGEEFGFVYS
jgi:hypothetical protein